MFVLSIFEVQKYKIKTKPPNLLSLFYEFYPTSTHFHIICAIFWLQKLFPSIVFIEMAIKNYAPLRSQ